MSTKSESEKEVPVKAEENDEGLDPEEEEDQEEQEEEDDCLDGEAWDEAEDEEGDA